MRLTGLFEQAPNCGRTPKSRKHLDRGNDGGDYPPPKGGREIKLGNGASVHRGRICPRRDRRRATNGGRKKTTR